MRDIPVPIDRLPRLMQVSPMDDKKNQQTGRRAAVVHRREYYEGVQYGRENTMTAEEFGAQEGTAFDPTWQRLPEHVRLHNYSDHIQESIDFLADQISGQYILTADDPVQEWAERQWKRSGLAHRRQDIARETMIAGDLFCYVAQAPHSDPDEPQAVWQLWEAESVEVDYDPDNWRRMVEVRTEEKRVVLDEDDNEQEERWVHRYSLLKLPVVKVNADDEIIETDEKQFVEECVVILEINGRQESVTALGLPFIPWVHIHGENESLRSSFGRSMISGQVMETVDRFNAVNQLEFQAVRYNSFGNAVVVGDEAYLRDRGNGDSAYTVSKDVADILVFPGGTDVEPLTLSINVEAYQDQREILIDELFGLFGLERIDQKQISSFGGVSGYALEILNRKTDGTFTRIVENQKQGIEEMIDMGLRVDAYVRASQEDFWTVDVDAQWPNREVEVDFGTAYIVDEVAVRDDFVARLISQEEALRKRGYDEDEIKKIMAEMRANQDLTDTSIAATLEQGTRFTTERA